MAAHRDDNMPGFTHQVIGIFGDFTGGQLTVTTDNGQVTTFGPGVHVFDAANQHEVSEVTSGSRYSVIAYAKACRLVSGLAAFGQRVEGACGAWPLEPLAKAKVPQPFLASLQQRGFKLPPGVVE